MDAPRPGMSQRNPGADKNSEEDRGRAWRTPVMWASCRWVIRGRSRGTRSAFGASVLAAPAMGLFGRIFGRASGDKQPPASIAADRSPAQEQQEATAAGPAGPREVPAPRPAAPRQA